MKVQAKTLIRQGNSRNRKYKLPDSLYYIKNWFLLWLDLYSCCEEVLLLTLGWVPLKAHCFGNFLMNNLIFRVKILTSMSTAPQPTKCGMKQRKLIPWTIQPSWTNWMMTNKKCSWEQSLLALKLAHTKPMEKNILKWGIVGLWPTETKVVKPKEDMHAQCLGPSSRITRTRKKLWSGST